jgi:flagellar biosynthetic protein FliO
MSEAAADVGGLGGGGGVLSFGALLVLCLVALVGLRWLNRRPAGRRGGLVKVLARCPLEPRRSLYVIETAGRCFLVGVGDGPMTVLAEVDRAQLAVEDAGLEAGPLGRLGRLVLETTATLRRGRQRPAPEPEPAATPGEERA